MLKSFVVDKSLGPNGWAVELFLHFYDLMDDEITEDIDDTHRQGWFLIV